ncbi:NUDIX domain-containing protein [Enterococcus sp. UD-01]|jgi:8-oxo-dGTP diphosphatase|uniref:NUDIX hydrolase n=1 Tax=Enterococcus sp. UD-01 TaxID=3373911 RepID=UPI003834A0C3
MKTTIIDLYQNLEEKLHPSYVVIISKYRDKYLFVKHKNRDTLEIPGGKIEYGETAKEAAERELIEETGAIHFSLEPIFCYEVSTHLKTDYGIVFFATIKAKSSELNFEIGEVHESLEFPQNCTYPDIQQKIFSHYLLLKK